MRTVTFSNPKVADRVNDRFIPVWYNRGAGFHNCEFWTEKRIFANSADCYPTKNICTFFLTPDREVAYYVAGYWAPDIFLEILDVVDGLRAAKTPRDRKLAHARISKELSGRIRKIRSASAKPDKVDAAELERLAGASVFKYSASTHRHGSRCLHVLEESLTYRQTVHGALAREGFVALKAVQHNYRYGNSFTEEPDPSKGVPTFARPQPPVVTAATPSER